MTSTRGGVNIELQVRDIALLRDLFESRFMALRHIAGLHFDSRHEPARKRVSLLCSAGYIRVRARHFNEPALYFLTARGMRLLSQYGHLGSYPHLSRAVLQKRLEISSLTLRHELDVLDVKTAFVNATRSNAKLRIATFSTWPKLHSFQMLSSDGSEVIVKPDGYIVVQEPRADCPLVIHRFFLEVDRSTESLRVIDTRCNAYVDYYRSGGFAVANGLSFDDYKRFPFRVLIITKSEERLQNIADRISKTAGSQIWLTTQRDFIIGSLGQIWRLVKHGHTNQPNDHKSLFITRTNF